MIVRRTFLAGVSAGLVLPLPVWAQASRKPWRIGILGSGSRNEQLAGAKPEAPTAAALLSGLAALGYVYGQHYTTVPGGGEGKPDKFAGVVAEMLKAQPDVIVAAGPLLPLLQKETRIVPVVMAASNDPVGEGLVQSLARPGANFTGLSNQSIDIVGKWLELLRELVPGKGVIAVFWEQQSSPLRVEAERAAKQLGWMLLPIEVRDGNEIEAAFKNATAQRAEAVLVLAASTLFARVPQVVELAARYKLPAMYHLRPYAEAGGLASYAANLLDLWRRSASFVDKILNGAKPADLPVEQPLKFELVLNLKAAKGLGLIVPNTIMIRADEVIE